MMERLIFEKIVERGTDFMDMCELIVKKKHGSALSEAEINWMIHEYTAGNIPDYQMSAFLMAVCFRGMSIDETQNLTMAMAESGEQMDLSAIHGIKVDKHSSGGVGDKTTLVVAPLAASVGVPVAKMSGRGLGHTGGTIDKLESISGFHTNISPEEFIHNVNTLHLAIAGQTANLAPADKKLYALRDVTGTVDQMSLIASSIMSKKLASGADAIVLDVKTGDGAFMKTLDDSRALAREMVRIGRMAGRDVSAIISDMDQPLGYAIGNALEVKEAIDTLRGKGPDDLKELTLVLTSYMTVKAGIVSDLKQARKLLTDSLESGKAFNTFRSFVAAQGGDTAQVDNSALLPQAKYQEAVISQTSGYVHKICTEKAGHLCMLLGGGRKEKDDTIDPAVGIVLQKKVGDYVQTGDTLAVLHINDARQISDARQHLLNAYEFTKESPEPRSLIWDILE